MNTNIQRTLNMQAHALPHVLTDKQIPQFLYKNTRENINEGVCVCCGWTYSVTFLTYSLR